MSSSPVTVIEDESKNWGAQEMIRVLSLATAAAAMILGTCVANAAESKPTHKTHHAHAMVKKHTASKHVPAKHVAMKHAPKKHLASSHTTGKACKGSFMYSKGGKCMDARAKA